MKARGFAAVCTLLLLGLAFLTRGDAAFALSSQLASDGLPTLRLPGLAVVGLAVAISAIATVAGRRWSPLVALAALALGFIGWAAADATVAFQVPTQLSGTLAYATPLVLGGLGGLLCERSGVVNIAIEGQFLMAALASVVAASLSDSLIVGLVAGMAAGVGVSALLGWLTIRLDVGQVMAGIAINLLVAGLTGFWLAQYLVADQLRLNASPVMSRWMLAAIAAVAVPLVWVLVFRTKWGLRLRAVGEHPGAAASAGVRVRRVRWQALLIGGALAGLGGCFFTLATVGQFTRGITAGYGFVALAALIMGRWRPLPTAMVALAFGFVMQLAAQVQTLGTPINSQLLLVLPYLVTLVAVAGIVGKVRAPAASGQNYIG